MNRGYGPSRFVLSLQLLGVLALVISIIILLAAADRLDHNRKHLALAGELSQTLGELRQLSNLHIDNGAGYSDDIARLIGYGDVQTSELSAGSGGGVFARQSAQLEIATTGLLQSWKSVKNSFAAAPDGKAPAGKTSNTGSDSNVASGSGQQLELQQFKALQQSFKRVFDAIANNTLSADLLAANSELGGTLKNLSLILNFRGNINAEAYNRLLQDGVSEMQSDVAQLVALTGTDGGIVIGYESMQLLDRFTTQVSEFTPALVSAQTDNRFRQDQKLRISDAIDRAGTFQQLLEFASHQNRRAILLAVSSLCIALLCLMLSLWRGWRNHISTTLQSDQGLEQLRDELCEIADGNLSVRASERSDATTNSIARAANHTVEMLVALVRVFRRAGNRLNDLAGAQQALAQRLIKSEIKRHEQIDRLSTTVESQSLVIEKLHEAQASALANRQKPTPTDHKSRASREAIQQLAMRVADCQEVLGTSDSMGTNETGCLTGEGLLKMRQRMHELSGTISAVRLAAEQARLQVLNTSLQMTAYAGTSEIDDQSRLVEEIQGISNQLASSAAGAERLSTALADDLQKYAERFDCNKTDLIEHFGQLHQATIHCLEVSPQAGVANTDTPMPNQAMSTGDSEIESSIDDETIGALSGALSLLQHEQQGLLQLITDMRSEVQPISDGDSIELLEQVNEIQKISANLARSAEMYGSGTE